jgi:hypothetical protein
MLKIWPFRCSLHPICREQGAARQAGGRAGAGVSGQGLAAGLERVARQGLARQARHGLARAAGQGPRSKLTWPGAARHEEVGGAGVGRFQERRGRLKKHRKKERKGIFTVPMLICHFIVCLTGYDLRFVDLSLNSCLWCLLLMLFQFRIYGCC